MMIQTRAELLAEHGLPQFFELLPRATKVGFYEPGGLYELTFGQQDADVEPLVELMKKHKFVKGKKVLEIFGGSAFESVLLKEEFPGNTYYSMDIADYFDKAPGINYINGDAFDPINISDKYTSYFDFVFVGHTNKSCCSILTLNDFIGFAAVCRKITKKGGLTSISFFEDTGIDYNDYFIEYSCNKIQYKKQYKGLYCHWGQVSKRDVYRKNHWYYPMVILSKYGHLDEAVSKSDGVTAYLYSDAGKYRSWDSAVVAEIMEDHNFSFAGDKLFPDIENFPFIKI